MSGSAWRVLIEAPRDGAANMARDEALLGASLRGGRPALRLYSWSRPTLSLGMHQPASDVDRSACKRAGVDLVRRPTGGGAVLHDRELTYAVVGRLGEDGLPRSVVGVYELIAGAIVRGLARLSVEAAAWSGRRGGPGGPDCFSGASEREIVVSNRKLVGSAQVRRRGAVLQHGSLLLGFDPERVGAVLPAARAEEARRAMSGGTVASPAGPAPGGRPITLREAAGREVSTDAAVAALLVGFREAVGLELEPCALGPEEAEEAERLRATKYLDARWTLEGRLREGDQSRWTSRMVASRPSRPYQI
jgi:lipoate-protein ligase A